MKNGKLNKSTDYEETITDKFNDKSINDKQNNNTKSNYSINSND